MGEVYRARDTRLRRDVAIKVLPAALANDPVALARFEREAQAVASLSHPNIVALYEFSRDGDRSFAAMELLDGESLRAVLARGALPVRKTVEYVAAIARGLSAAHARGVIHRDLKPENVFLTRDGQIKILDFGLARADAAARDLNDAGAATIGTPTLSGTVLGTVGYMAPEQARGATVDHRADLFALGAMLYEMVAGRRAFARDTAPETLTAILKDDPEPLSGVAPGVPAGIVRVASICLEKRPEDRFESARDVALALETLSIGSSPVVATVHRAPAWRRALRPAAAVTIVAALGSFAGWRVRSRIAEPPPLTQFTIHEPAGDPLYFGAPAISPDGRFLAYVVADGTLEGEVRIRPLGSLGARTVPGTTGAGVVHWSPDSRVLIVRSLVGSKLWKVPLDGGPPQVLAAASGLSQLGWDTAWMETGTVLYTGQDNTIWRMDASGGSAKQLTTLDNGAKEWFHGFPQPLPDGRHFLFHVRSTDNAQSGVYIAPLDGGAHRLLLRNTLNAVYAEPGYVLFAQAAGLVAQRLDVSRLALIGEPISLGLAARGHSVGGLFASASTNGTLVTASAESADARLVWVDRRGAIVKRFDAVGRFFDLSLSPSGSTLALNRRNKDTEDQDVWTMDLDRGVLSRLTNSPGNEWVTSWSPDGRTLAFTIDTDLFRMLSDGSGPPVLLRKNARLTWATDWSPDGRFLLCQELTKTMGWNVIAIALDDPESSRAIAKTEFDEQHPRLSANGTWLAYTSNESGRNEIYIQPFPSGGKLRVSVDGGAFPRWRRDGRELYYVARDASLVAVGIDTSLTPPRIGQPETLFTTSHPSRSGAGTDYVPSADGQRFLVTIPAESSTPPAIIVTVNWPELIRGR